MATATTLSRSLRGNANGAPNLGTSPFLYGRWAHLALLLAALIGGSSVTSTNGQGLSRSLEQTAIPLSLGINAAQISGHGSDLVRIARSGARYVRHSAHWGAIEQREGVFDFSKHREFFDAAKGRGIGVVFILAYNNQLYEPTGNRKIVTDAGRKAFAAFAAAAADHFRGENVIWEIWNEPNTKNFWGGEPNSKKCAADYARLVHATVPAMRKADPHCIVVGGSVSNLWPRSYEWMQRVFEQDILKQELDGWSVHPYGLKSPEESIIAYETVRDLIREFGGAPDMLPILNTECGYSLKEIAEVVGPSRDSQEEYQASMFVRQYLIDLMCDVRLTIWYAWQDKEFGMVDGQRDRPVYAAFRVLNEQLAGYAFEDRIDLVSPDDFVAVFRSGDRHKLVAWTTASPHDIFLDVRDSLKSVDTSNMFGHPIPLPVNNGRLCIELSGNPRYVDLRDAKDLLGPSEESDAVDGKQ